MAGATCLTLALTLTACDSRHDHDGGWYPVFIPWSQPHQPQAPAPRPAYRAPAPAYRPPPIVRAPIKVGK